MCAQFQVEAIKFRKALAIFALDLSEIKWKSRILPHLQAPVILSADKNYKIDLFNFSLVPPWSKERKPKFATHNTRIETVLEKPTWKKPFAHNHCLVPVTEFIEPIYNGEFAGNMIKFVLEDCVFVPAIYDHWTDKETGEVINSFSILTTEPLNFVKKIGHDRSPIFLRQEKEIFDFWFDTENHSVEQFLKFLSQQCEPKMSIAIDRKMKTGWEKRK